MAGGNHFLEDPGTFPDYDMDALGTDQAYVRANSGVATPLYLYGLNDDCVGCPYTRIPGEALSGSSAGEDTDGLLPASGDRLFTLSTKRGWKFLVYSMQADYLQPSGNTTGKYECVLDDVSLGEFGVYELQVQSGDKCSFNTLKEPVFIYGGLVLAVAVYLALLAIVLAVPYLLKKVGKTGLAACCCFGSGDTVDEVVSLERENELKSPSKQRIKSLDTFRGLSIVLMILVNYGAGGYWFMGHATWDGLLVADVVFPWFMWIMGVCIPMGLRSALKRKVPKWKIFRRIAVRSAKLFIIGIILNSLGGYNALATYRVPGVLQRFGVCYFVVASVALFVPEIAERESKTARALNDVISLVWHWAIHLTLLAGYLVILFVVPVPGCPTGYLGPGGVDLVQEYGKSMPGCIGGVTGLVDRVVLGVNHLYQNPTAKHVYQSSAFDPEGVLGVLPSIFQVFLGYVAGNVLHHHQTPKGIMGRWAVWGAACGVLGIVLSYGGAQGAPIPVNKNLWSLSFVLVTSCLAFLLLALCYLLVDHLKYWSGAPLYQAGMNSIFLYVGHMVAYNLFPWHYAIGPMRTHASLLTECLWGTTLWVLIGLYLHHKGKFYTV